jgi:hypothetical protein
MHKAHFAALALSACPMQHDKKSLPATIHPHILFTMSTVDKRPVGSQGLVASAQVRVHPDWMCACLCQRHEGLCLFTCLHSMTTCDSSTIVSRCVHTLYKCHVQGLGCMGMTAFYIADPSVHEAESLATLDTALELGVTFLDTV